MASSRLPSFRSLFRGYTRHIQPQYQQRRWAQVHDVRFLATHHTSQQVKERYREKLTRKAKECAIQLQLILKRGGELNFIQGRP